MSNPADNTEGCEVCGLDRQVLGCRPGKCKNEKAPPLGYTKCPTPGCPRWMGPNRLKCWSETLGGNSGAIYPDWEPPPPAAPEHPLPWRWATVSDATDWELRDAAGKPLFSATNSGTLSAPSAFIRAVTERAGAMEALLRRFARAPLSDMDRLYEDTAALLAEIHAAKAGG